MLGQRTPASGAGIVSFRKDGADSSKIVAHLKEHRILASARAGWVRTSPHFYILPQEIEQMIGLLP